MHLFLESRRKKTATLEKQYPDAVIIDLTSKGEAPWVKFSPFFPHGDIPIPFSEGLTAASVEGIWQGLKVFENDDVDVAKFANTTMKGLKRTVRKYGTVKGHRRGVAGEDLLPYVTARHEIYLPSYRWVLDHKLQAECDALRAAAAKQPLVLLDYETNADINNPAKPLSHASLVIAYLQEEA